MENHFLMKHDALGDLNFGGIAPTDDDTAMYFSLYHLATGSPNTCTMVFGKVNPAGAASMEWQFESSATATGTAWCLIPQSIVADGGSVYFTATMANSDTSTIPMFFKSTTDGTLASSRGFRLTGGETYLLSYQVVGGFVYMHGFSDNSVFAPDGGIAAFIMKTEHDFANNACSSLSIGDIVTTTVGGSLAFLDSNTMQIPSYVDGDETFTTTIPAAGATTSSDTVNNICTTMSTPTVEDQTTYKGMSFNFGFTTSSCTTADSISYTAFSSG